jgi:hypothetical protein
LIAPYLGGDAFGGGGGLASGVCFVGTAIDPGGGVVAVVGCVEPDVLEPPEDPESDPESDANVAVMVVSALMVTPQVGLLPEQPPPLHALRTWSVAGVAVRTKDAPAGTDPEQTGGQLWPLLDTVPLPITLTVTV